MMHATFAFNDAIISIILPSPPLGGGSIEGGPHGYSINLFTRDQSCAAFSSVSRPLMESHAKFSLTINFLCSFFSITNVTSAATSYIQLYSHGSNLATAT
jgi:hypothetical protein